jgi:hypothetical protein
MIRTMTGWAAAMAVLACAAAVQAHHSMSMFDLQKSIWLQGTVVSYEPINPHARLMLEQRRLDGQVQRWLVEGPNLNRLQRMGVDKDFLKAGDVIEVCGFPFRQEITRSWPADPGAPPRPVMHAHMLVMPNGHMRLFGPYGKLDNCIRSQDTTQSWVEFLNADPLGRQAWCAGQTYTSVPSTAPKGFVDEVNRLMANYCD